MKKKTRPRGIWLIALGTLLIAAALIGLLQMPSALQYSVVAPTELSADAANLQPSALAALWESWAELCEQELSEVVSNASVSARDFGASIASDAQSSADATLVAVGPDWFSVNPKYLTAGRLLGDAELKDGARAAVLDDELAFKLFPTSDPLDGSVRVGDTWYRVVGTVRHARSVGDFEPYALYIPLARAAKEHLQFETVEASGIPIPKSGASRAFLETAERWVANGSFCDVDKEVMRATMLLRALVILFGFFAVFALARRVGTRAAACVRTCRKRLHIEYLRNMLPGVLKSALAFLLIYAALIAAGYALLSLAIEPMYVFPEWIPDVLVEWSSIAERFRQLTSAAARPIRVHTRELSEIRFWAGVLRWGVILLLSGLVVLRGGATRNLQRRGA